MIAHSSFVFRSENMEIIKQQRQISPIPPLCEKKKKKEDVSFKYFLRISLNFSENTSGQTYSLPFSSHLQHHQIWALLVCYTCQDLMTVCYVFIWTEPLHLVTGYHQPIHSLAKIKSSNYSLTNQGCFGFFFFQKVLNSINSSLTRNGKGLISRIIVLLLQFAVFKFSCWLDWKFYDTAYETCLIQL